MQNFENATMTNLVQCDNAKMPDYKNVTNRKFNDAKIPNSEMQKYENAKMREFENAKLHSRIRKCGMRQCLI